VLLLRGPQTPGELKQRSERMAPMPTLADVERVLGELIARGYVVQLERRPGQKEERYDQLLGGAAAGSAAPPLVAPDGPAAPAAPDAPPLAALAPPAAQQDGPVAASVTPAPPAPMAPAPPPAVDLTALETRVAALESELAQLREQLADLLT
jgi:uncharacterized protein YceH (UPF0502 family)